jgi:hypothetical protein
MNNTKFLAISLVTALIVGGIVFVGVPAYKAWADSLCLIGGSVEQLGSDHEFYPCGYKFVVLHKGKNGEGNCDCDHRTTGASVHIVDTSYQPVTSISLTEDASANCGQDYSDRAKYFCATAHCPTGTYYYYFTCNSATGERYPQLGYAGQFTVVSGCSGWDTGTCD